MNSIDVDSNLILLDAIRDVVERSVWRGWCTEINCAKAGFGRFEASSLWRWGDLTGGGQRFRLKFFGTEWCTSAIAASAHLPSLFPLTLCWMFVMRLGGEWMKERGDLLVDW